MLQSCCCNVLPATVKQWRITGQSSPLHWACSVRHRGNWDSHPANYAATQLWIYAPTTHSFTQLGSCWWGHEPLLQKERAYEMWDRESEGGRQRERGRMTACADVIRSSKETWTCSLLQPTKSLLVRGQRRKIWERGRELGGSGGKKERKHRRHREKLKTVKQREKRAKGTPSNKPAEED